MKRAWGTLQCIEIDTKEQNRRILSNILLNCRQNMGLSLDHPNMLFSVGF
jgi:hypothetical protein